MAAVWLEKAGSVKESQRKARLESPRGTSSSSCGGVGEGGDWELKLCGSAVGVGSVGSGVMGG